MGRTNVTMSNISVHGSPIGGKGLFTTKSMKPGDAVLELSQPLAGAVYINHLLDTCAECFVWTEDATRPSSTNDAADPVALTVAGEMAVEGKNAVRACTGCKVLRYCSKVS